MNNGKFFLEKDAPLNSPDHHGNDESPMAYIIDNSFEELSQLSNVYTVNQFFVAFFSNDLPKHSWWIMGQGIPTVAQEILQLCAIFCSNVRIHTGSLGLLPNLHRNSKISEEKNEEITAS